MSAPRVTLEGDFGYYSAPLTRILRVSREHSPNALFDWGLANAPLATEQVVTSSPTVPGLMLLALLYASENPEA